MFSYVVFVEVCLSNFVNIHDNHTPNVFSMFVCRVAVVCYLARDGGGGRGTILGPCYIIFKFCNFKNIKKHTTMCFFYLFLTRGSLFYLARDGDRDRGAGDHLGIFSTSSMEFLHGFVQGLALFLTYKKTLNILFINTM